MVKRKKGLIKNAMNRYDSQYAIVVANNKKKQLKKLEILFIFHQKLSHFYELSVTS